MNKGVNVMRKITALILAVLMVAAFSACKKKAETGTEGQSNTDTSASAAASATADASNAGTQSGQNGTEGEKSSTFVAPEFTIGSENKTAKAGDVIEVPLSVSADSTIAAIGLSISYDTDKLEFSNFSGNNEIFLAASNEPETGTILISMVSSDAKSVTSAVDLGTLNFKAKGGASGESKLNISCTSCCDENSNELHPTFNDPVITIG